ncbi:MAG: phosphatidylserine decarboxylase family protein [Nitrospinaceae bacterium]|jgi:phosphatidylserine decarboxylase|nr:MAG: phosphatidylserine decarboxylase family protein [Nitrospinaceae bacterium]
MRIPIAKEGYPFILPLGLLTLVLAFFDLVWAAAVAGLLFLFVLYFFRDPEREIPNEPKVVVSPADGKVVVITTEEDPFMGKTFTRISIFLNVFNVHVNRVPVAGVIAESRYNPGKFLNAMKDKASMDNEQNILLIRDGETEVLVKQIAGLIARRIVCWAKPGDRYELGQRFGLIRFGSRVDIFLPQESTLKVAVGDKVAGGSSIIGYLP